MYCVFHRFAYVAGIMVCLLTLNGYAYAENVCKCPDPPGGAIRCEDFQVGFCKLKNGKIDGECTTPPPSQSHGVALHAWVLSKLLQTEITPEMIQKRRELQEILNKGIYVNPHTSEKAYFMLPR